MRATLTPPSAGILLAAPLLLLASVATAEPLPGSDIGALNPAEVRIVQELLYQKAGKVEAGLALGVVPNDPYVVSGSLGLSLGYHLSETLGVEANFNYLRGRETAESDRLGAYGIAVDGFTPLLQGGVGVTWVPIYAKLNLLGRAIVHYDLYLAAGLGVFLAERSILAGVYDPGESALERFNAPFSGNLGLGQRFFIRPGERLQSLKVEAKDHVYVASTPEGERWLKHNIHLTAGWGIFF